MRRARSVPLDDPLESVSLLVAAGNALSSLIWEPTETQYLIDARAESDARTLRATVIRHHVRGFVQSTHKSLPDKCS